MTIKSTILPMLCPDGSKVEASVEWEEVKFGECRVAIGCGGRFSEGRRSDFFDALEEARLPFEADGYRLICYGASLNVFPSSMGRSCVLGIESYQFSEGGHEDTKNIFETGKDVIPVRITEQRRFFLEWLQGREGRDVEYNDDLFKWAIEPLPEKQ